MLYTYIYIYTYVGVLPACDLPVNTPESVVNAATSLLTEVPLSWRRELGLLQEAEVH